MSRLRASIPVLLLSAGIVLVLSTFRDYGLTWDESVQARYGEEVLDYFLSGFRDTRCNDLTNMRLYGPLFDTIAAAAYSPWPGAKFEIRHLLNALLGLGALAGVYRLGRRLGSVKTAVLAALFLATLPRFYGDAFNNPKDVPFACAFVWFVTAFASILARPSTSWRSILACGAALGWVGAARPGGLPLALLVAGACAAWAGIVTRQGHSSATGWILRGTVLLIVAWACMILPWPWAHQNPVGHPLQAMRQAASFGETYEVLFAGVAVPSTELPRTYPLTFFAIATPLGTLAFAALGLARAIRVQVRDPRGARSALVFLVEAWLFLPISLFLVVKPNVYDGMRHFLFVLPALALLAAFGAEGLLNAAAGRVGRAVGIGAVTAGLALPTVAMIRLHPYEGTFFNALVGGVRGASGRYETDYWASAYKEAAEWINSQRRSGVTVLVAANPYSIPCASYYLAPGITARRFQARGAKGQLPPDADFYIGSTRWDLDRNFPESPIVFRVERAGATFAVVRSQRPMAK